MFGKETEACVGTISERELLRRVREWLRQASPASPAGMGDDAAVVPPQALSQLLTVDALLVGRHFDLSHEPERVGAKLLKRNLSDVAAMGGEPMAAVVALAMGGDLRLDWLEGFYRGLANASLRYRCPIVGGDVSEDTRGRFGAFLTVLGYCERPLLRAGAQVGSSVWVTGSLGGSLLGRHLDFEPRLAEGRWLAGRHEVCAMMDVSDGLGKDLSALCGETLAMRLESDRVPLHEDALCAAREAGRTVLDHALNDGEDYELLFALDPCADEERFAQAWAEVFKTRLTRIGKMDTRENAEAWLIDAASGEILNAKGFSHFKR